MIQDIAFVTFGKYISLLNETKRIYVAVNGIQDKEFIPSKIQKQNLDLVKKLNGKTGKELVEFVAELLGEVIYLMNPSERNHLQTLSLVLYPLSCLAPSLGFCGWLHVRNPRLEDLGQLRTPKICPKIALSWHRVMLHSATGIQKLPVQKDVDITYLGELILRTL